MDKVTPERRSQNMSKIRSRDTSPELIVRQYLYSHGLRYRLHSKNLPGKPDLVFASRRLCVFVHGCFWHGCPRCIDGTRRVKSNEQYWSAKVVGNQARDVRNRTALVAAGWTVLVIWECEIRRTNRLSELLAEITLGACSPTKNGQLEPDARGAA
jgi:DNA mismatch endonuclease (patch repair protein)